MTTTFSKTNLGDRRLCEATPQGCAFWGVAALNPGRRTLNVSSKIVSGAIRKKCRGYTLLELVVSVAIYSLLIAGTSGAILISSKAFEIERSTAGKTTRAHSALNRLMADVRVAQRFTERTDKAARFSVPDRDGDGNSEMLRYAWSGVAGDPLTLEYNGGAAVAIAEDVHHFNLAYLTREMGNDPMPPSGLVESQEMVLCFHDSAPGANKKELRLDSTNLASQYFQPTLPAGTVSWKITQIKVMTRNDGGTSQTMYFQIRLPDAALKPTITVLEQKAVPESSLPGSFAWHAVSFDTLTGLNPGDGFCLVLAGNSGSPAGKIQYEQNGNPMTSNTHWMSSSSAGVTWSSPNGTEDIRFYVYGTVTRQAE